MSDDEFNRLIQEMLTGLPITITLNRLVLVLRAVVQATDGLGADTLRTAVDALRARDRQDYFGEEPL